MENRRSFLKKCVTACAVMSVPGCVTDPVTPQSFVLKSRHPKTALVFWYSQTGHTERYGQVIARALEESGLAVISGDVRQLKALSMADFDLVVAGSPVHYYDAPDFLKSWVAGIDRIDGAGVAAYSSFGGPGNNQYNTACTLLQGLAAKGGVPVGIRSFGNMSTFAPTWSMGNEARILKYRHLPNQETYQRVARFAADVLEGIKTSQFIEPDRKFGLDEIMRSFPMVSGTKLMVGTHTIDSKRCVQCGICVDKCPVGAVNPAMAVVNTDDCIVCMGCVNNCPEGAVTMTFMDKKVIGFFAFLEHQGIEIETPEL
ncbi:MAG: EFR1 family ferrodoxin [Desulfobacterium sp.]|nr:EFR1 family ferrodoxin [Desulfobacterium sp.]